MNSPLVPDCIFPSDNSLEIPELRLDMQAEYCEIPFVCFGEQKRTYKMKCTGTLHFYTDDYRFSALYDHPERILSHNPACIVEPNYSLFTDTPIAFGLTAIYKKRWLARMMQEHGIRVFVDLNVAPKYYSINLIGVPKGYKAFSTRGHEDRMNQLETEYQIALKIAETDDILFLVYGGGNICREFCKSHHCIYVNPVVNVTNQNKYRKKLDDGLFPASEVSKELIKHVYNYSNKQTI